MCEPYFIEKIIIIIDLCKLSIFDIPSKTLNEIINYCNNYFSQLSSKIYLLNPSKSISNGFSVVRKILTK